MQNEQSLDLNHHSDAAQWAARYIDRFGLFLVEILPGRKHPTRKGWNQPENCFSSVEDATRHWKAHPQHGIGVVLAPSGLVSLDVDHVEYTRQALAALGLDLDELKAGAVCVRGNPERFRLEFQAPAGVELSPKKLAWPAGNGTQKQTTVFELHAGNIQDVLPPTIHPKTGRPYIWENPPVDGFTPLPVELLELWRNWDSYKTELMATCPWAEDFNPPGPKRAKGAQVSVIAAFNEAHDVTALLAAHDYKPKGKRRWIAPSSQSGLAGVVLLDSGRVFSHHGADPLADDHSHDAFDCYRILEHGGDSKAATKAAAAALGIELKSATERNRKSKSESEPPADTRLEVKWIPGQAHIVTDQAAEALAAALGENPIYQRCGALVRTIRRGPIDSRGIKREAGSLTIVPVDAHYLMRRFDAAVRFEKFDGRANAWRAINCPERLARAYLSMAGEWRLPYLTGIIEAPTLRPDGSILDRPGYDADTGLLFDPGKTRFESIPTMPSKADAEAALKELRDLLAGFPFARDGDEETPVGLSVVIAGIQTALVRRSLHSAPMFAFSAPKMGSGKSLLADVVSLIATGRPSSVMAHNTDADEEKKRLLSVLLEGDSVVCIDNIEKPLESAALCSILTQSAYKDRLLGGHQSAEVSTAVTWTATGNNLTVAGDLTTRVLLCTLDPQCERPEEREFKVNLYESIPSRRGALVRAALTILRAYHVAGRPKVGIKPYGRFEDWSNWIRAALVWLGMPDPCKSRESLEDTDPDRMRLRALLDAWRDAFESEAKTVRQAIDASAGRKGREELWDALQAIASKGEGIEPRKVGNFLTKYHHRIEDGKFFDRGEAVQRALSWRVLVQKPSNSQSELVSYSEFPRQAGGKTAYKENTQNNNAAKKPIWNDENSPKLTNSQNPTDPPETPPQSGQSQKPHNGAGSGGVSDGSDSAAEEWI